MGNLSQAVLPNNTVIGYTYDAQGRLIAKRVNGVIEYRLIYSGQLAPVAKVDADGDVLELYISGTGANSPDYIVKAGSVYRVIKDHLGSTRMIVNANTGDIVKDIRYSEFGEITEETGTFETLFSFAGGIRDTDTGLTRFGARWYDSETGRWISKEPLGFAGSNNFYSYVNGDPVNKIDITGLAPGDVYKTYEAALKAAAWDVIKEYGFSLIYYEDSEHSSTIYEKYNYDKLEGYSYTAPITSGKWGKTILAPIEETFGRPIGYVHTHPNINSRGASTDDFAVCNGGWYKGRIIKGHVLRRNETFMWEMKDFNYEKELSYWYALER